jgi:hypothetical protein
MNTSRRDFIKIGLLTAVVTGTNTIAPVSSSAQIKTFADDFTSEPSGDSFLNKTADDLRHYIGAEFLFLTIRGAISVVLSEVTEEPRSIKSRKDFIRPARGKSNVRNYVASFQMPNDKFSQETYRLRHPDFGEFDLFLVPGKRGASFLLHAVVNRL